jgi:hypothetical protein
VVLIRRSHDLTGPANYYKEDCCLQDDLLGVDRLEKTHCSGSDGYCSFAYSDLAEMRMGISGSAPFHCERKS